MNTGQSIVVGWGALLIGAGGAYLYVRQEIDERHRDNARTGRKDNRILSWDERLALDAELEKLKQQTKEAEAATASLASRATTSTTAAIKSAAPAEFVPHKRVSYLDPSYGKKE